jgi:hypothetical protein
MLLLNRPGNDSVGLQPHAAGLRNTRSEYGILSRFSEGEPCSRKTFSLLLEAFNAEDFAADWLFPVRNDCGGWSDCSDRVQNS